MISNPYEQYRATAVETAPPTRLVAMLFQGVQRYTQRGIQAIERNDIQQAHDALVRSQRIVEELAAVLDFERGGEVARNLATLYDYALRRLIEANCKKATGPAIEVLQIFRELASTWQSAVEAAGAGRSASVQAAAR